MTLKWEEAQRPAAERQVLGPSKLVDAAWHAHITDTKSYAAFCDRSFGGMVHHDPNCGPEYYSESQRSGCFMHDCWGWLGY